jgi:hypothetical protein
VDHPKRLGLFRQPRTGSTPPVDERQFRPSTHNFLNRENITFVLLKVIPHVKYWWEYFCEQKEIEEPSLFIVTKTLESFRDATKEQYYPVGSYDDLYRKWSTLRQERDQAVPDFANIFHTLRTKCKIPDI